VEVALEVRSIESETEVGPRLDQMCRGGEELRGERVGVTYGATHADVKLPNERDFHQGRPRDPASNSTGPGLDSCHPMMSEQVVGPLLRCSDGN
jgi:hypothetical protein